MTSPSPPPVPSTNPPTTNTSTTGFVFPREYSFPPFFTRQPNPTTLHAQLVKWSSLVLSYCRHHRIFKLNISSSGITSSTSLPPTHADDLLDPTVPPPNTENHDALELFHNRKINRQLSLSDIRLVIDFLKTDGRAEYISKSAGDLSSTNGSGSDVGDIVWIYWRTPEEWASLLEAWVDETGQKGSVLTLYELTYGEGTRGTEFHGLDPELLQKALATLVKRGKAQIFGQEDSRGVKFF
ncbi:ESCRT-II complex subunit domain containing protein [Naviculisporaceae sp. PSN 640]